jgi:hypothetical protein
MNPILQEYIARYTTRETTNFPKFFTQFSVDEYAGSLPYLFEIEGFCLRIFEAFLLDQKVCIYSDYDTDAMTATGVMYWGLIDLGFSATKLSFYAPDRFVEGYGMNTEAAQTLSLENDLIISVDCGINSVLEAEIIAQNSCELIITDHHHLQGKVPECVVVNPRLAEYWSQNDLELPKRREKITNQLAKILEIIQKSEIKEKLKKMEQNPTSQKLEKWLQKVSKNPDLFLQSPEKCLSSSTTGVGVAWFCLVWFAYFLQEMEA